MTVIAFTDTERTSPNSSPRGPRTHTALHLLVKVQNAARRTAAAASALPQDLGVPTGNCAAFEW